MLSLSRVRNLVALGLLAAAAALAPGAGAQQAPAPPDDDASYEQWLRTPLPVYAGDGGVVTHARNGTLLELPTRTVAEWTPDQVRAALAQADNGALERPADLVETIMGDDRVHGVLSTLTHGLLGLPTQYFGAPEQVAALQGTVAGDGRPATPGDWTTMFPEAELAQLFGWGVLLGVGLGERVHDPARAILARDVPRLKVWHPRWLRHDWVTQKWWLMTSEGEVEIHPGDGQWILFTPYGSTRPWVRGAWRPIAFAWCLKQFALHDRARHSEIQGGAARVGVVPQGANEGDRKKFLRDLRNIGRNGTHVLPVGYDYKIVEATARTWEIYGSQIEWADRAIAITLVGQFVTTEGTKGFSNGNIHDEVKHDKIRFLAEAGSTTLHDQGVVPWAQANWGNAAVAPWQRWDTDPPQDKKAVAEALKALGDATLVWEPQMADTGKKLDKVELLTRFGAPLIDNALTPGGLV